MKRRFLSSMLALVMAASTFGGFMISASAEPLEGVEYSIDFSTWEEGEYTLDEIIEGAKDRGITLSDRKTENNSISYSIVEDTALGKKVLKMSNTAATEDGLNFVLAKEISGTNATYFVKSMTTTTMHSNGLCNKYVYNSAGKAVISGAITGGKTTAYVGNTWANPVSLSTGEWLEETCVFDTSKQTFMYISDKGGRYKEASGYNLPARYNGAFASGSVYIPAKVLDAYVEKFGVRTFPTVIGTKVYSGGEEIAEGGTVSTSLASVDVVFDHYMETATMKSENIKLYNKTSGQEEAFGGSVSYNADTFTLSIEVGSLNANSNYDLILTGGFANTDNISLKETKIALSTGAAGFEFASFKITDEKGNDLGVNKVVASKAVNAVFEANNPVAGVNVMVNGVEVDYEKSEDMKSVIVTVSFENDKEYTIEFTNLTDSDGNTMEDMTFVVTTNEKSKDYFVNDFEYLTQEAGTMLNSADILPEGTNVTITPAGSIDGVYEVIDNDGDKSIKVTQPENNREVYGFKMTFENDLFTLLGNENVVVELDYNVDNSTLSTYAALARMNNTACLYICNGELIQQTIGTLATGMNGKDAHYKMVLNSDGKMNLFINGERIAYNNSYDISFRSPNNKPTVWEIYIQKGAAASYIIDNLRIRNYPEASLSFKNDKGVTYDSEKVVPSANGVIYVTFDNKMNENSIREDSFSLYDSLGNEIECAVGKYDAYEQRVAITPVDSLEMGKSYEVRIDSGVVNTQNRQLAENVYTFETINVAPVKIEKVNVTNYNEIEIEFSDYIDEASLTSENVKVGSFDVTSVVVDRNPENYKKHKAVVTIDGVLEVGEGSVELTGGFDRYSRSLAGLAGTYNAEDKLYISSVDFVLEGSSTEPKVSVAVLGGSAIDSVVVGGAYFEGGNTLKSISYEENGVVQGDITRVTAGEIETAVTGSVEVYVWNSLSDMVPLCEKVRVMKALTVHIAGDSKVAEYALNRYPQQGWGHYLANYLIDSASVHNRAQSGTTTTTFRTGKVVTDSENPEDRVYADYKPWEKIIEVLKEGDYVIIDLAHNDKYSTNSGKNDIEAYKENIKGYVNEIRNDYNAIPILMSTVPTLKYNTNELADYGAAMREVAEEMGTIFLDINTISWSLFEEMGLDNARNAFYMSNYALKEIYNMTDEEISVYPNGNVSTAGADLIHFSWDGADKVAELVANEIAKCDDNIALYVK